MQLGAGVLLVLLSVPWSRPAEAFVTGGRLTQASGFLLVALLVAYLYISVRWAGQARESTTSGGGDGGSAWLTSLKLVASVALVVVSAHVVIPGVTEAAHRISVPESIVAATLVAFGTSLPELVTAVTAAKRGHGELAVGNVIGADILNVLFVAGTAAAVTSSGLQAGSDFFTVLYPAMLLILLIFRAGIVASKDVLPRSFGFILLAAYGAYLVAAYFYLPGGVPEQ